MDRPTTPDDLENGSDANTAPTVDPANNAVQVQSGHQSRSSNPGEQTTRNSRATLVCKIKKLFLLHFAFFWVVIGFLIHSNHSKRRGLWDVKNWEYVQEEQSTFDNRSLLWTTLPAFFFSLFTMYMKWCYADIHELMPYLKLYGGHDRGKHSILVNYGTESPYKAIRNSWQRKHRIVSFSMSISFAFSIAVVPLSAHLFETKLRTSEASANATRLTVWNDGNLNERTDYSRALEVASVIAIYNNSQTIFSQWMNTAYAFPSFVATEDPWPYNSTVVIPYVTGIGASLSGLKVLSDLNSDYSISRTTKGNATNALKVSATEGGCLSKHEFPISRAGIDLYFDMEVSTCRYSYNASAYDYNSTFSRLSFFLAWPKQGTRAEFSTLLIIGDPVHFESEGELSISVRDGISVNGFELCPSRGNRVSRISGFEEGMLAAKASSKLKGVQTNAFGSLILDRFDVARRNATTPWDGSTAASDKDLQSEMLNAIDRVYRTVFMVSAGLYGFQPTEWPFDHFAAQVSVQRDVERLFVVTRSRRSS